MSSQIGNPDKYPEGGFVRLMEWQQLTSRHNLSTVGPSECSLMTLIEMLESRQKALRVDEVAELLEVSKQHVYEMIADGTLPGFQVGRSIRIDPQDLADWLRKNRSLAAPQGKQRQFKTAKNLEPSRNANADVALHRVLRNKVKHAEVAAAIDGFPYQQPPEKQSESS